MAMLKLTMTGSTDPDTEVYVVAKHVAAMYRNDGAPFTWLYTTGNAFRVRETPEEIMAMDAMRLEMDKTNLAAYPSMNIGSNLLPTHEVP